MRADSEERELQRNDQEGAFNVPDARHQGRLTRPVLVTLTLATGVLLGLILFVGLAHVAVSSTSALWHHFAAMLTGPSTSIDVSSPAIVERIRKLSRLETVVYSMDKIVEGERESPVLPNFLVGDKLLLIAHGEVVAGVDLGQLQPGDVSVNGDAVRIHLPNAQVLSTRIDNTRTHVYSRTTGVMVTADPTLESKVREAAEQQIGQAAIADGILDRAHQNAQASVSTLLYGLGFHNVEVD
jgi:hypothetical protein